MELTVAETALFSDYLSSFSGMRQDSDFGLRG